MVDHIADEVDQMILGHPLTQARRKQKPLFWKVRTVALAHDPLCTTAVPVPPAQMLLSTVGLSQTHLTSPTDYFSDTLLDNKRRCCARSATARTQPIFRGKPSVQQLLQVGEKA